VPVLQRLGVSVSETTNVVDGVDEHRHRSYLIALLETALQGIHEQHFAEASTSVVAVDGETPGEGGG
jgi:hypothetical protein